MLAIIVCSRIYYNYIMGANYQQYNPIEEQPKPGISVDDIKTNISEKAQSWLPKIWLLLRKGWAKAEVPLHNLIMSLFMLIKENIQLAISQLFGR